MEFRGPCAGSAPDGPPAAGWPSAARSISPAASLVHLTAGCRADRRDHAGRRADFGAAPEPDDAGYVVLGTPSVDRLVRPECRFALTAGGLARMRVVTFLAPVARLMLVWDLWSTPSRTASRARSGRGRIGGRPVPVAITPAAGYVSVTSAVIIGAVAWTLRNLVARLVKNLKVDDSLDAFACHGIGGAIGVIMTAPAGRSGGKCPPAPTACCMAAISCSMPICSAFRRWRPTAWR